MFNFEYLTVAGNPERHVCGLCAETVTLSANSKAEIDTLEDGLLVNFDSTGKLVLNTGGDSIYGLIASHGNDKINSISVYKDLTRVNYIVQVAAATDAGVALTCADGVLRGAVLGEEIIAYSLSASELCTTVGLETKYVAKVYFTPFTKTAV